MLRSDFSPAKSDSVPLSGTRVGYALEYDVPVPIIGNLLDLLAFKSLWVKRVQTSLQNLERLLESRRSDTLLWRVATQTGHGMPAARGDVGRRISFIEHGM
jgi:hypothetical protein